MPIKSQQTVILCTIKIWPSLFFPVDKKSALYELKISSPLKLAIVKSGLCNDQNDCERIKPCFMIEKWFCRIKSLFFIVVKCLCGIKSLFGNIKVQSLRILAKSDYYYYVRLNYLLVKHFVVKMEVFSIDKNSSKLSKLCPWLNCSMKLLQLSHCR